MTGGARKRAKRRPKLHPSPLAFALDGSVIASVALLDEADDPTSAVREALKLGGRAFVGVELRDGEVAELRQWLGDAAYEKLAFVVGARLARRRKAASRKRPGVAG